MMAGEFAEVYERLADHTVVLDVYGAREDPEPGRDRCARRRALRRPRRASTSSPTGRPAADRVAAIARDGDIVMTLSCGDVYRIVPQVLEALGSERS